MRIDEKILIYTNPLTYVYVLIVVVFYLINLIYIKSGMQSLILIYFRMHKWDDEKLKKLIDFSEKKQKGITELIRKIALRKAKQILKDKDKDLIK